MSSSLRFIVRSTDCSKPLSGAASLTFARVSMICFVGIDISEPPCSHQEWNIKLYAASARAES